jgi:nucleotide-binding universal stress UspA family protein
MKTVLVPTDFSKYASIGIHVAAVISQKTGCPITLHHNVTTLLNWEIISQAERMKHPAEIAKTETAERKLTEIMDGDLDRDLRISKLITHGITHEEIVSKAKQLHADLIIMGSHGNEGSERFFIGSTIQRVIREATCPVLAARSEFSGKEIKTMLFASDFDEQVDKPFGEIKKIATALGATIHLLFINTPEKFKDTKTIRSEMNAFTKRHPEQKFEMATYNHRDPVSGILEYSDEVHADMIATITHDRRHRSKYLVGNTESLVFHAEIPVLSVNSNSFEPVRETIS